MFKMLKKMEQNFQLASKSNMPFFTSYFHSVYIGTIPRFISGKTTVGKKSEYQCSG